jgi:hypothetical protein
LAAAHEQGKLPREEREVIIALFIGMFGLITCAQFGISWWRAMVAHVAEHPLSARGRAVAERWASAGARDFHALVSLNETCPFASSELGAVRVYFAVLEKLKNLAVRFSPTLSQWANHEMDVCFRYAVVRVDERLTRAHSMMAEMRNF